MKAMLSTAPGGPETLVLTNLPDPAPGKGQIRIKVHAAGLNFPDTLIIRDLYQMKPPRPFAPGGEVAGVVDAMGEGVTGFAPGDRVLAMTGFGGFATHVVVDARRALPIPAAMPYEEAACFVFTYGTSHHALKNRANLQAGESVLILGAAGGVGVAAIELAKASGSFESENHKGNYISLITVQGFAKAQEVMRYHIDKTGLQSASAFSIRRDYGQFDRLQAPG